MSKNNSATFSLPKLVVLDCRFQAASTLCRDFLGVRNAYHGFGSEYETLLNAFDKDIASFKKRVGKDRGISTLWAMQRSRKNVAEFIQLHYRGSDMSMLELTPQFIEEFAAYLSTERGLESGTIWQTCMWLKGVVMRAHYNGKIPRNPFAQFHISPNCKEREFLTEEELKAVMTHEFEDAGLAFVRDIFVFICWTALAFVDVKNLTTDDIVDINGDKWIVSPRHKTNVPYQVKLMDVPLQIIARYKHLQEEKLVFGKLNYWSICKKLKKVISACGIEKQISLHCGRHSWATLALSKGMPIESVSRVLGHTNIVTTQIYARITSQKLKDNHARELNQANEQHQQEVSNLKRLLDKAYRWFPSLKRFLDMERECLAYGFNTEQTDKLLHGQSINYSGWLHSNEYRRNFLADNVIAQVIRDEKRNLFLHINDTPIAQLFKEQFGIGQEQRRGFRV